MNEKLVSSDQLFTLGKSPLTGSNNALILACNPTLTRVDFPLIKGRSKQIKSYENHPLARSNPNHALPE
jgi:hypothetical protein